MVDSSNGIWNEKKGLKENQFRNVAAVGVAEECVEVIINFIKYQMGRSKKNKEWNLVLLRSKFIDVSLLIREKAITKPLKIYF